MTGIYLTGTQRAYIEQVAAEETSYLFRHVKQLIGLHEFLSLRLSHANLAVAKIAGRVRRPWVAKVRVGPHAEAAAAGVEEPAQPAPAFNP